VTGGGGRVATEAEAVRAAAAARAAGRRVVFTNGAFDLLHVGHVRMLRAAAALGDLLVVGVNDDASVRASRGPGRPVVPAAERVELVAAVGGVDLVFPFHDPTVARLLESIRPHVHAKGREYAEATHPEAAVNRRLGIEMAFVGDEKGHAATDLRDRMRVPPPDRDRYDDVVLRRGRGRVLRSRAGALVREGLFDLPVLLALEEAGRGVEVWRHATRTVRRVEIAGDAVYVKAECPARRGPGALDEAANHVALRAAGFRAPEPWLALEGPAPDGRSAGVLVTREARGEPLDRFLAARFPGAGASERAAWAFGLGSAVRALCTARFLLPDLLAHHVVVDGSPAGGVASLVFLDLARVERARGRVTPRAAAPGLAALALSLRPHTSERFRLAVLRAVLGGTLRESRRWLRAIARRVERVKDRGTFRRLLAQ
jgi:rfaE bifunctional protein nucleotidyltransferase chain/domain